MRIVPACQVEDYSAATALAHRLYRGLVLCAFRPANRVAAIWDKGNLFIVRVSILNHDPASATALIIQQVGLGVNLQHVGIDGLVDLVWDGTAEITTVSNVVGTDGYMLMDGGAAIRILVDYKGSGDLVMNGTAAAFASVIILGFGNIVMAGGGDVAHSANRVGSGDAVVTGQAGITSAAIRPGLGDIVMQSSSVVTQAVSLSATGDICIDAAASVKNVATRSGAGDVVMSGGGIVSIQRVTLSITWGSFGSHTYPYAVSSSLVPSTANISGVFSCAASTPNAGTTSILVTFTPTDLVNYAVTTSNVPIAITKATVPVTWSNTVQTYNSSPQKIYNNWAYTADYVVDGVSHPGIPPFGNFDFATNVGTYNVSLTINETNYAGSGSTVFTINKATATINSANVSTSYNGSPQSAMATTTPAGLSITYTYNGSTTPPTNAGIYTVVGTINDANYQGSGTWTLTISKANQSISAISVSGAILNPGGGTGSVSPTLSSAGLPVAYTSSSGNLVIAGTSIACVTVGTYTIYGNQSGDANHNAAAQVTKTLTIVNPPIQVSAPVWVNQYLSDWDATQETNAAQYSVITGGVPFPPGTTEVPYNGATAWVSGGYIIDESNLWRSCIVFHPWYRTSPGGPLIFGLVVSSPAYQCGPGCFYGYVIIQDAVGTQLIVNINTLFGVGYCF